MALLGSILKRTIELRKVVPRIHKNGFRQQVNTLRNLLSRAEYTAFGEQYNFSRILNEKNIVNVFRQTVPEHDYNSIFRKWWYRTLNGESFICWPGKVKYFALSSGTSESSSKHIPVTKDMLRSIRKTSLRQLLAQSHYNLPKEHFERGILMLGGSTHLNFNGTYFEGDLSGITTGNIPFWFQHFYKPGKRISRERDWSVKLDEIVASANKWDISTICGVPSWVQILIEKIIEYNKVNTIHDIWPNLSIYVHGGVSFSPYKKGFEKLLARPIIYMETYLASEGFIAYHDNPNSEGMRLTLDNGVFFEFVPFTDKNFDAEGNLRSNPETFSLAEIQEDTQYALLMSTCAGVWRYLLGDTIKFTSLTNHEIIITGRTKHFLNLCGEHLSQDNMNRAIELVSRDMNIHIKEFSVAGIPCHSLFAHKWFIGTDDTVNSEKLKELLDEHLKVLNDDYRVERLAAIKNVFVKVYPTSVFYEWMEQKGKMGAQNKFPRVMKNKHLDEWEEFLNKKFCHD
ncbi:MAG: GH3 auxin-responsive promoter family protein [Bacteroidota bacterium]